MKKNHDSLILVVDDSEDNQTLLEMLFVAKGYRVHCASNGEEALALLKELSVLPDVIFLDAQMPVMDGYQFRIEQKKSARLANIPVVVMTGDDDQQMYSDMSQPHGILIKPLGVQSVIDMALPFLSP